MEIQDFPNYLIYPNGDVWSKYINRFLKPATDEWGYNHVNLNTGKVKVCKTIKIHRLVALAYIPNPNNYPIINHINQIKTDNRVENLEWCSNLYNTQPLMRNLPFGSITEQIACRPYGKGIYSYYRFELSENGKRYVKHFKTKEEAEIYREITKEFYIGLVLN